MRIVQISDTHIGAKGELLYGMVDTGEHLSHVIDGVNFARRQPDCVLITGDTVEPASAAGYKRLAAIISNIEAPVFILPGNHDSPELMTRFFDHTMAFPVTNEVFQYVIEDLEVRILMLNSHQEDTELPCFGTDRAMWLDEELKISDRPTLVAIHHPPMVTGISWVDMAGNWYENLERVIAGHRQVKLVICGHAHMVMTGQIAHAPIYAASSSAYQLISPRGEDIAPIFVTKPAPAALHNWDGQAFRSFPTPSPEISEGDRIDTLSGLDWEVLKARMRGVTDS